MKVPSLSHPGTFHDVEATAQGVTCTCPRFSFNKDCTHVRVYLTAQHAVERCREAGHIESGAALGANGICLQCLVVLVGAMTRKVRHDYVTKDEAKARVAKARARRRRRA
jgi:hypothetical protein